MGMNKIRLSQVLVATYATTAYVLIAALVKGLTRRRVAEKHNPLQWQKLNIKDAAACGFAVCSSSSRLLVLYEPAIWINYKNLSATGRWQRHL